MIEALPAAPDPGGRALLAPDTRGSGMLEAFGPAYTVLGLPFFFRNLRMEDHSVERVREAATRGPVVYVMHTRSHVDWLALNRVLVDHRLPLPVFTNNFDATAWMPLGKMWRHLTRRVPTRGADGEWHRAPAPPDPFASGWLADLIASGAPTCIFLVPPRENVLRTPEPDPLPVLLQAQARTDRPVQVVPVVVVWDRSPERSRTEVGRFLLGTEDRPGALGKLLELTTRQGDAIVQTGEPIPLPELIERYRGDSESRRLKALRLALRRWLYREARVVRGPRSRPREWVRRLVLDGREMDDLLAREALATGKPKDELKVEAAKIFDRIAARFSFPIVRISAWLCRQIWNRIYSGIDLRPEDMERIREAMRAGSPVILPCHRSHLDYMLIFSVLYDHDVVIPHVVAGDNLSFFPAGPWFRRCGAFFIRRSFSGDRLFPVVFSRYLAALVKMEVPVEFFLEGGRSRTGKLLPPKLGVLGMVMDAAAEAREDRDVTLLPVYIGYEQIAEERAYASELLGGSKKKEDVGEVVKAAKVLGRRFGKVYLRVGEPLRARDVFAEITPADGARIDGAPVDGVPVAVDGAKAWSALPKARRGEILMGLGERILHRIDAQALALPTAIVAVAILAHPRRGLRHEELKQRVVRLRQFLAAAGVPEGSGMAHVDGILAEALGRFTSGRLLQPLEQDHGKVYSIVADRRVTLEYYKNTILHAFAPAAFWAGAVRALGEDRIDRDAVSRLFRFQQLLLRFEFILDPDADLGQIEARAIDALIAYGALGRDGDAVVVADRARIVEIANLTANFLESYLLVLRAARASGPMDAGALTMKALDLGKTLLAVDELSRPESLNRVNIENAIRAYTEEGVLRRQPGGAVEPVPDPTAATIRDLCRLLGVDAPEADR